MRFFHVWHFSRKKRWLSLITLSFLFAAILFFYPKQTFMIFSNPNDAVITKGNAKNNNLALTFNIAWGNEKVYDILEVLDANEIKATFFVSGEWAERHPQIIEEIQDKEHEIGMLGYRYKNYEFKNTEQIKKDMSYAKSLFKKIKIETEYIRPPVGTFDKDITTIAENLGLQPIQWSIDAKDTDNLGTKGIISEVKNNTKPGDIILFHASDSAIDTASALKELIPFYKEKGLSFVTVSTLLSGIDMEEKLIKEKK